MAEMLVCRPLADCGPRGDGGEEACGVCRAEVWVTAHMLPHVESGALVAVCIPCGVTALAMAGDIGRPMSIELHPDQRDRFAAVGRLDEAEQAVGEINRAQQRRTQRARRGSS